MAISLPSLISRVRVALADVPTDMMDDIQVYRDIQRADDFIDEMIRSGTTETMQEHTIVNLAAYYSYINYTSLAERQLGNVPAAAYLRIAALKEIALAFLRLISDVPLTDNLVPDWVQLRKLKTMAYSTLSSSLEMSDYE